jgi:hypothetical protein
MFRDCEEEGEGREGVKGRGKRSTLRLYTRLHTVIKDGFKALHYIELIRRLLTRVKLLGFEL